MHCDEVMEEVSLALLGDEPRGDGVVRHLGTCESCRKEARQLEEVWKLVGELPEGRPAPELRRRFEGMLEQAIATSRDRGTSDPAIPWRARLVALWSSASRRAALGSAAAALLLGLLGGALLGSRLPDPDLEDLRTRVAALQEMVALSLRELDSASRRLQAVRYSTEIGASQPPLLNALVQAVERDPNVNIRLAALDALAPVAGQPEVMDHLLESLPGQKSALVQIVMIDLLLDVDGVRVRRAIRRLAEVEGLPMEVRQHIEARLGSRI